MNKQSLFSGLTIAVFIVLLGVTLFRLFYDAKTGNDQIIAQEVKELVAIIKTIDKSCKIIGFDRQKNPIDFLNIKSFSGSEVGSMNLAYPQQWKGPYMEDNPTIQQQNYMVVRTKKGYFVTPGEGVKLGNGKVIGKDIIVDENADILLMMRDKNALGSDLGALAAPLYVGISPAEEVLLEQIIQVEDGLVMREQEKLMHLTADF